MTAADRETLRIFAGSGGKQLAESMAQHLNLRVSAGSAERFPDGEVIVRVQEDVRGRDCFVVQSTCEPVNDRLVELWFGLIACVERRSSHHGGDPLRLRPSRSERRRSCAYHRKVGGQHAD